MINVLLVEDNRGDVRLTQEAFKEAPFESNLIALENGEKALDYLQKKNEYGNAVTPHLVLLDLNLPKKSGLEVLEEVKKIEGIKRIPIIVLSTSAREKDILDCYDAYANCFFTKPLDMDEFMELIASIGAFWFDKVRLPLT